MEDRKHKVITLCGSTRFKEDFYQAAEDYTKNGFVVFYPSCYNRSDDDDPKLKDRLCSIHRQMIIMSDAILVINKDGYIGESTKSEIEFAQSLGKKILYFFGYFGHDRGVMKYEIGTY